MTGAERILALIPARKGSKRLPGKNGREFLGKPLLVWAIEAAQESKYVNQVIVSTDDSQFAKISRDWGAQVPFLRPARLSDDNARTIDVVHHTIQSLKEHGEVFTHVLLLQPTSPLRTTRHIDQAVDLMLRKRADCVVSVTPCSHPHEFSGVLPDDFQLEGFFSQIEKFQRSQDLPRRHFINGAIYLFNIVKALEQNTVFLAKNSYGYEMDALSSIDIDTEQDFRIAEALARHLIFDLDSNEEHRLTTDQASGGKSFSTSTVKDY